MSDQSENMHEMWLMGDPPVPPLEPRENVHLVFQLQDGQPMARQLADLRDLIPEIRHRKAAEILQEAKSSGEIDLGIHEYWPAAGLVRDAQTRGLVIDMRPVITNRRPLTHFEIAEFRHLWESGEYVVVRLKPGSSLPVHAGSRSVLLIEDDDLADAVIETMVAKGVPVVDRTDFKPEADGS